MSRSATTFPPLKSALDDMSEFVGILEEVVGHEEKLAELFSELQVRIDALESYISKLGTEGRNSSVSLIVQTINEHIQHVKQHQKQGTIRGPDAMKRAQKIEVLLQRLHDDVTLRTWENTAKQLEETWLARLSPVSEARYNSSYASIVQRGRCTPGTREELQKVLQDWARGEDIQSEDTDTEDKQSYTPLEDTQLEDRLQIGGVHFVGRNSAQVFWLNGMAGTGKTTIAYSFCEWLENNAQLGASFFCSRTASLSQSIDRVIPTIAYQLGRFSPAYKSGLCETLEGDPDAATQDIEKQFDKLIVQPMESIKDAIPNGVVVVIDALDECEHNYGVETMLNLLIQHVADLPIKFFIASRPEPAIREKMLSWSGSLSSVIHLHDIDISIVENDIRKYLTDALKHLIPCPTNAQILQLAKKSGKLFIYAATLVRYICPRGVRAQPKLRLQNVLDMDMQRPQPGSRQFNGLYKELDRLYSTVLDLSFAEALQDQEVELMQDILRTVVCVREPITIETLAGLLELAEEDASFSLGSLHSVLHVPEGGGLISTLHASFPDFLIDKSRAGQKHHCDQDQHNRILAQRCFAVMKRGLQFNVCGLDTSFTTDSDVPDLQERFNSSISSSLFYACRSWGDHLRITHPPQSDDCCSMLFDFLSSQLLFWMEVMNLAKLNDIASSTLFQTRVWVQKNNLWPETWKALSDAQRFLMQFGANPCSLSTPHIYISALPLCPRSSFVYRNYRKLTKSLIDIGDLAPFDKEEAEWMSFRAGSQVESISFSHDGTRIFYATFASSQIGTWCLYNSSEAPKTFSNQTSSKAEYILSIATSSDGAFVVASTFHEGIQVYDARSGRLLREFGSSAPTSGTLPIAISRAKSTYVACGCSDEKIRLWDIGSGERVMRPLQGHNAQINSVSFSPVCLKLASGSADKTIRLWDTGSGTQNSLVLRGHSASVNSVAFSSDGVLLASGSSDRSIRLWDVYKGVPLRQFLEGHTDNINSIAFAPDCTRIVSGSSDGTVRLWDINTGTELIRPFARHTRQVSSVEFSPDGAYVVSSSGKTIRLWDTYSNLLCSPTVEEGAESNQSFASSNDNSGRLTLDGLWDIHTNQKIGWHWYEFTSSKGEEPDLEVHVPGRIITGELCFAAQSRRPGDTRNVKAFVTQDDQTIVIREGLKHAIELTTRQRDQVLSVAFSPDCVRFVLGLYAMNRTTFVCEVNLAESRNHAIHTTENLPSEPELDIKVSGPMSLTSDGWVRGINGQMLFWFPPSLHRDIVLLQSPYLLLIAGDVAFETKSTLSNLAIGDQWAKCYVG